MKILYRYEAAKKIDDKISTKCAIDIAERETSELIELIEIEKLQVERFFFHRQPCDLVIF